MEIRKFRDRCASVGNGFSAQVADDSSAGPAGIAAKGLLVAALYFLLSLLGLLFSRPGGLSSGLWPAAGFALGALIVWGPRYAAGVFLGALAKAIWLGWALDGAFISALGPTLQALAGYWLTRHLFDKPIPLSARGDIIRFLLLAGPLGCLISASVSLAAIVPGGSIPPAAAFNQWIIWWVGDVLGIALFTPMTLLALPRFRRGQVSSLSGLVAPLLAAALVLGQVGSWHAQKDVDQMQSEINRSADQLFHKLRLEIEHELDETQSLARFFALGQSDPQDQFTDAEFAAASAGVLRHPGVVGVEWLPRVRRLERANFERGLGPGGTGPSKRSITERDATGAVVPAGDRTEYFPTLFAEPRSTRPPPMGTDRSFPPPVRLVMTQARDSGQSRMSAPSILESTGRPGVKVFVPVYQGNFDPARADEALRRSVLQGYVLTTIDLTQFLEPFAQAASAKHLEFRITDTTNQESPEAIADSFSKVRGANTEPDFQEEAELAGARWRVELKSSTPAWQQVDVVEGKLFSALLVLFALLLTYGVLRIQAQRASLMASENRLASMMRNLNGLVFRCYNDPDWTFEHASDGCRALLGLTPQDLTSGRVSYGSLIHPEDSERVWLEVQAALQAHHSWRLEYRVRHTDGHWIWVWEQGLGVWDVQGQLLFLEGFITDISSRKLIELELENAEQFVGATLDALSAHIAILDKQGQIVATNRAWQDFAAANGDREDPRVGVGSNYLEVCQRSAADGNVDAARTKRAIEAVMRGERERWEFEYPCHSPTEPRWFYCRISQMAGAKFVVVAHENISAIRATREALDRSAGSLRAALDAIPDMVWLKDTNGVYLDCNPAVEATLGLNRDEILGRTDVELVSPQWAALRQAHDRVTLEKGGPVRYEQWTPSIEGQRPRLLDTFKTVVRSQEGEIIGIFGLARDITSRKRIESALNASNSPETGTKFLEHVCRILTELTGTDVGFVSVLLGSARARTIAMIADGKVAPALEYSLAGTPCEQCMEQAICVFPDQVQQRFPADANLARLQAESFVACMLWGANKNPLGTLAVIGRKPIDQTEDVTLILQLLAPRVAAELERASAEAALAASEKQYRNLVESVGQEYFFYRRDGSGHFSYLGPSVAGILGWLPEDLLGRHFTPLRADAPGNSELQGFADSILDNDETPQDSNATRSRTIEVLHRDGRRVSLEITERPVLGIDGRVTATDGIAHDVTARLEAEREATRANALFKEAVAHIAIGFVIYDPEDRLVACNEAYLYIYETSRDLMVPGTPFKDIIQGGVDRGQYADTAGHGNAWVDKRLKAHRAGNGTPFEQLLDDGRWVLVVEHRTPSGYTIGNRIDITERKHYERRLVRMNADLERRVESRTRELEALNTTLAHRELEARSLLDNLVDAVIHTDSRGVVRSANQATTRILGYTPEELVGCNVSMLMPEAYRSANDRYLERRRSEEEKGRIISVGREIQGLHKRGHLLDLELAVGEYQVGSERFFTGILRDVQERKQVLIDLKRSRDEAEAATRAKSAFLAAMSHEIRTPMNGVIASLDLLGHEEMPADQAELVDIISESAFSLLTVIDDILDFSKLEAGKLLIESDPVELERLLEGICSTNASVSRPKSVDLGLFVDPALPRLVMGDAARLRQILNNLIGNAIKFSASSERRGRVAVRAESKGDTVAISVSDNGIGMSEATIASLFSPFMQADASTTRRFGGTGLGLSISKHLVDAMGGRITVNSQPRQGSSFIVELPVVVSPQTAPQEGPPSLIGLTCHLVGEDEGHLRDLKAYLTASGATVLGDAFINAPMHQIAAMHVGHPWLVLHDTALADLPVAQVQQLVEAVAEPHLLILLGQVFQQDPRNLAPGVFSIGSNPIARNAFLHAVALAAGMASAGQFQSMQEANALKRKRLEPVASPSEKPAILVAEDNDANQRIIQRQLSLLGYSCDMVGDGLEALKLWRKKPYGLLLSDMHMPRMDGPELATAIRLEEKGGHHMPIIACTANILPEDMASCITAGMDDMLSKPFKLPELRAILEKWSSPQAESGGSSSQAGNGPGAPTTASIKNDVVGDNAQESEIDLPVLDATVLVQFVGDDTSAMAEVLGFFRHNIDTGLAEFTTAWHAGNATALNNLAHKLRSSSLAVGAMRLGKCMDELERSTSKGDIQPSDPLFAQCGVALTEVAEKLRELDSPRQ